MSYLQLRGVEKVFGDVRVIKGVDLKIEKGEFVDVFDDGRDMGEPRHARQPGRGHRVPDRRVAAVPAAGDHAHPHRVH